MSDSEITLPVLNQLPQRNQDWPGIWLRFHEDNPVPGPWFKGWENVPRTERGQPSPGDRVYLDKMYVYKPE